MVPRLTALGLIVLLSFDLSAGRLNNAFAALAQYDYFKAKRLFGKLNKKNTNAYAAYGLAVIYLRNDNPFHNIDSALRYVNAGWQSYAVKPEPKELSGFVVDIGAYRTLADSVCAAMYRRVKKINSVQAYESFLLSCYLAAPELKHRVVEHRDNIELNETARQNNSAATKAFIETHPASVLLKEAQHLYEKQIYEESTSGRNAAGYLAFLRENPNNRMVNQAYEKLFAIYRSKKDSKGLAIFVKEFPDAPQNLEAWKLLFSLSVKAYSYAELRKFLDLYPEFPLRNSILHELELNKIVLYPFQQGDFMGFLNEKGILQIPPVYDDGRDFSQGLALVHKEDSAFYINKENINPFNKRFEEAGIFRNGLAPVKIHGKWFFMNRLGQLQSEEFEEINEIRDQTYVVKQRGRYGAVDQFGQLLLEPKFEKLGDFLNDVAYYQNKNKYGFVSLDGYTHPAIFDWVSDFSGFGQAVVKSGDKFGLIDRAGKMLLETAYDQLLRQSDSLYLVVKDEYYGFYSAAGCFIYDPVFDYLSSIQSGKFSDGRYFKLNRKGQQAIGDQNGATIYGLAAYDEVFLPSGAMIKLKKKGKFGYCDENGKLLIPPKFDQAGDFENGTAIVRENNRFTVIGKSGDVIFSDEQKIERLGKGYFVAGTEPSAIISSRGEILYPSVVNIQMIADGLFAFEAGGTIKIIADK